MSRKKSRRIDAKVEHGILLELPDKLGIEKGDFRNGPKNGDDVRRRGLGFLGHALAKCISAESTWRENEKLASIGLVIRAESNGLGSAALQTCFCCNEYPQDG
jgi:hypothetical protein